MQSDSKETFGSRFAPPATVFVIVLLVWQFGVSALNIPQFLLPPPATIFEAFTANADQLEVIFWRTVYEAVGGMALGTLSGIVGALLAVRWNLVGRALIPFAVGLNAVPTLIFAPIMNNWFGSINPLSNMMIVVTLVYYPIMINIVRGLVNVEPAHLELMQSYGASQRDIFLKLRVPNSLPFFFNAMKLAATLSVIGTVVAGYFGGPRDALGVWILNEAAMFNFPDAWAGILIACGIGIGLFAIIAVIETFVIPWHASVKGEGNG